MHSINRRRFAALALGLFLLPTSFAAEATDVIKVGEFSFKRPAGWTSVTPASSMRAAQLKITGAKDEGLIFAHGKPLRKIPQEQLVDTLFEEIDKSLGRGKTEFEAEQAAEGEEWLRRIEEENAGDLTPEKIAAMEKAAAEKGEDITAPGEDGDYMKPVKKGKRVELGEDASPTAGRRFTRA